MKPTDWIGFTGVAILLLAFFLNLANRLHKDSPLYILLNIIGAGIACLASILISYLPFIILEGCWTVVSIGALINFMRKK
ncbi:MAG: CBU_0592 family membrane protein [Bacteroidia bacterium]